MGMIVEKWVENHRFGDLYIGFRYILAAQNANNNNKR